MKKLMLFAAAAAMVGGAFGATCVECPLAYKIKVIVRTTKATEVTNATATVCGCFRKPATRRFIGYYFGASTPTAGTCGSSACGCVDWSAGESVNLWLALWNFDTKAACTPNVTIGLLNRIGFSDTSKAEMVFDATYADYQEVEGASANLRFAGFGTVARRADGTPCIKTMSGFCAGTLPGLCMECSESVCGSPVSCSTKAVNVWKICAEKLDTDHVMTTVITAAYGKWKMKWDAEMANRLASGATSLTGGGESLEEPTGFTPSGYATGTAIQVTANVDDVYDDYADDDYADDGDL